MECLLNTKVNCIFNPFELPKLRRMYLIDDLLITSIYANGVEKDITFSCLFNKDSPHSENYEYPLELPELLEMFVCPNCGILYSLYGDDRLPTHEFYEIFSELDFEKSETERDYNLCSECRANVFDDLI